MKKFTKKDITTLFSNLCCSYCKNDFSIEDIEVLEKNGDLNICHLMCHKCGKDFGEIVFNFDRKKPQHLPLEVVDGPKPISYDDVIDAHRYIEKHL